MLRRSQAHNAYLELGFLHENDQGIGGHEQREKHDRKGSEPETDGHKQPKQVNPEILRANGERVSPCAVLFALV